jgi:membrane protein insertase Oxa1/YidC/SpoIIIJ
MFGFFSLQFSVGLSIYFVISNVIGIVQYSLMGDSKVNLRKLIGRGNAETEKPKRGSQKPSDQGQTKPAAEYSSSSFNGKSKRKEKTKNR